MVVWIFTSSWVDGTRVCLPFYDNIIIHRLPLRRARTPHALRKQTNSGIRRQFVQFGEPKFSWTIRFCCFLLSFSHFNVDIFIHHFFFFREAVLYARCIHMCSKSRSVFVARSLAFIIVGGGIIIIIEYIGMNSAYNKIFSFFFQRAFLLGRNHVDLFCFVNSHVGGIRVRRISACRCRSKCQTGLSSTSLITWSVLCD